MIDLSVVHWHLGEQGWSFDDGPGTMADPILGARYLREVYLAAKPDCTSRVTVPVLWDRAQGRIVSNESSEIIRMFNGAFDAFGDPAVDLYPEPLRPAIDAINQEVYANVNNGVYRCGFATSQAAYEEAYDQLFAALDELDHTRGTDRALERRWW